MRFWGGGQRKVRPSLPSSLSCPLFLQVSPSGDLPVAQWPGCSGPCVPQPHHPTPGSRGDWVTHKEPKLPEAPLASHPTPGQAGTSVMAIFFLSKDSRICCSSFCVGGIQCGHGPVPSLNPATSCQDPPGTAAQRPLPPGTAHDAPVAQVLSPPEAGCWLPRGTVGEPPGQPQGHGLHSWVLDGGVVVWDLKATGLHLPRPWLCSSSARYTGAGTEALAPGGPPAAPEGPGSAFSEVVK